MEKTMTIDEYICSDDYEEDQRIEKMHSLYGTFLCDYISALEANVHKHFWDQPSEVYDFADYLREHDMPDMAIVIDYFSRIEGATILPSGLRYSFGELGNND
jgi:hypothetical protein